MQSRHKKLNSKYITDADTLLKKGDYVQASEKYWGAVAQMIKLVAAKQGVELGEHKALWIFISELDRQYPDQNLWSLFEKARLLHMNFYGDEIPKERVKEYGEASRELIKQLKSLLTFDNGLKQIWCRCCNT